MSSHIHPADIAFFSGLANAESLSVAAREMGISTAAVSKHLAQMEARMGVSLLNRTTRRMSLTPEGQLFLGHARRILESIDELEHALGRSRVEASGLLRVNATLGFGRAHIAPLISKFARRNPQVEVQLQLTVNPPALTDDAFDVCIRFGAPPEARVVARRVAANRRLLCASPAYIARHGMPQAPADLARHNCIGIRQGEEAYGVWRLTSGRGKAQKTQSIRTRGSLSTNDGEIAVNWALEGHGIVVRAEWDIERFLANGRLVQVLAPYSLPDADIYAVYARSQQNTKRVRAFVDFVADALGHQAALRV